MKTYKGWILIVTAGMLIGVGNSVFSNHLKIRADVTQNSSISANLNLSQNPWPSVLTNNYGMVSDKEPSDNSAYAYRKIVITFDSTNKQENVYALYFDSNNNLKVTNHLSTLDWNYSKDLGNNSYYFSDNANGNNNLFSVQIDEADHIIYVKRPITNGQLNTGDYYEYHYAQNQNDLNSLITNKSSNNTNQANPNSSSQTSLNLQKGFWPSKLNKNFGMVSNKLKSDKKKAKTRVMAVTLDSKKKTWNFMNVYYDKKGKTLRNHNSDFGSSDDFILKLNYVESAGNNTYFLSDSTKSNDSKYLIKLKINSKTVNFKIIKFNGKSIDGYNFRCKLYHTEKAFLLAAKF